MKYALFKYNTRNIGDEIQSLAARQFLPQVDYYIERDSIGSWKCDEDVKLIANAWYMHDPMDWPVKEGKLDILPISIHVNQSDNRVRNVFAAKSSVGYLNKLGDIGARDHATQAFLSSVGVSSVYFSGCLTLTLQRDDNITSKGFILCVSVSDEVYDAIKKQTNRTVLRIDTTTFDESLGTDERLKLAEQFLYLYQSAHMVVTTRLHAAMPCLAFEVPVVYIVDNGAAKYDPSRLEGLKELTRNTTEADFIADIGKYDFNKPKANPKGYKKYRTALTNKCEAFTGCRKKDTYAVYNDFSKFNLEDGEIFKTIIFNYDEKNSRTSRELHEQRQHNSKMKKEVEQLSTTRIAARKIMGNAARRLRLK